MVIQKTFDIRTQGRGTTELTSEVHAYVRDSGVRTGICHVFILHTSASLMLCENADPSVLTDLEIFMSKTVPDGDPMFRHTTEGPDDMPAHVRSVLTDSSLTLPIKVGRCLLGTWQGIYIWEHRHSPHNRKIVVTVYGE
jgi:secondary thiamine-phosphate synthase enzyme